MPKPQIGKIVRYMELGVEFAALITRAEDTPNGMAMLTVFGPQGQSYRTRPYSEEIKEGHWSWVPMTKK